jgi:phage-related protein
MESKCEGVLIGMDMFHQDHHRRETEIILHAIQSLSNQIHHIMSAISDFATKMASFQTRIDTAISDLQGDVDNLTKQIAALQASSGTVTPEDQALLDGIQSTASGVADKLDALDALTPPVAPVPTA